jgi:hypothetical protein
VLITAIGVSLLLAERRPATLHVRPVPQGIAHAAAGLRAVHLQGVQMRLVDGAVLGRRWCSWS